MIAIYPSNLGGLPMQTFSISKPITLYHWLHNVRSNVWEWLVFSDSDIALDEPQRFTAQVNGVVLPQTAWASRELRHDDAVALTFEPKGGVVGDIFGFVGNVVSSVFGLFFRQPSMPNSVSGRQQGDELDQATFDTNQAKLNKVIPECFGLNWRVPDLLVQTHQRFEGNIQVSYMHLSLGVGQYRVEDILIGNTPIGSFGSDAQYRTYGPDENHDGFRATENWFTAKEVGGTSSASPGLEITETFDVQTRADPSTYVLGSNNSRGVISVPSGSGSFPDGWAAGMDVRLEMPLDIRIERDGTGNYFVGEPDNIPLSRNTNVLFKQGLDAQLRIADVVTTEDGQTRYYLADRNGGANVSWIEPASYHVTFNASGGTYRITSTNASTDDDANKNWATQIEVERLVNGEIQADWTGFASRTVNDGQIWLSDNKPRGGYTASIAACPHGETTDSIEIDIFAPQGLAVVNPKGHELGVTVNFDIEYRDMAGGEWQAVPSSVHGDSLDQFGATVSVGLPYKMRPEVRLRKTGSDYNEDELGQLYDTIKWYALKAKLDRPSSYPGITSVAIQIRTGERLGAQAENKIKVRCTRMLPPWNNAVGDPVATRDIAPAFMYMLRAMGYSDSDIDMAELGRLHDIWQQRGDYFDMQFLEEKSLKDALNTCLGVGFAELVIDRGYIVPVRDEPRSTYGQAYSLHNMTSELKISTKLPFEGDADQHDGADVEYVDFSTGQKETVKCRLPGQEGIKVLKVTAEGINDRQRAWRYGMRQIAREKYRIKQLSFSTGMDALNSPYLDYVAVNGDYDHYGQSAQVIDYQVNGSKATIDTDQVFDWSGGEKVVGLQRPNGKLSDTYGATRGDNDSQIIITAPDFPLSNGLEVDATRLLFGSRELPWWSVLIDSVKPQGTPQDESEPQCSVRAYNYDTRIYQYDDAPLPDNA
ncbi:host specificity factor TipJ family phage tail protein [Carnimonas bestiolae]|uniref:host specificity factor TipJ family phage tail protein n=1 Tax=Carnimonas bestiolae TaxID=3402172 RepID=UPI003EDBF21F